MNRLVLLSIPLLLASPVFAADLDRPRYTERDVYIERPARVIERPARVIIERQYIPVPVYEDDDEPIYAYRDRPYRRAYFAYNHWRPNHYVPRWRHFHHDRQHFRHHHQRRSW